MVTFTLLILAHVSLWTTVGCFGEVVKTEGGTLLMSSDTNLAGNDVMSRAQFLPSVADARRSWVDLDTTLTNGTLTDFYVYVHDVSALASFRESDVRLQIWRPVAGLELELVWQYTLTVETSQGALYKVNVLQPSAPFYVLDGDHIGWGLQHSLGVISFDPDVDHRTTHMMETESRAEVGQIYTFSKLNYPSVWSVACRVNPEFLEAVTTEAPVTTTVLTSSQTESQTEGETTSQTTSPPDAPTVADTGKETATFELQWWVYGPIIAVAGGSLLLATLVIIVYKYKQHKLKSIMPQYTA